MGESLEVLVKTIVESLVDRPDEVTVTMTAGVNTSVYEVKAHPDDVGKLIGRGGSTANAIRLLLNNAAGKYKTSALLQIVEPRKAAA